MEKWSDLAVSILKTKVKKKQQTLNSKHFLALGVEASQMLWVSADEVTCRSE